MFRKMFFVVVLMIGVVSLSACSNPKIGDKFTAPQDIVVVEDYDTSSVIKETCTINKGEEVEVTDFSSIYAGDGTRQSIVEFTSTNCTGWWHR